MAYDESLADDVRARLAARGDVTEMQMFGGLAFLVAGHMAVGVKDRELMIRAGDGYDEAVGQPGARPFDPTGRAMRGWLMVAEEGFAADAALDAWVARGVQVAEGLPPKG